MRSMKAKVIRNCKLSKSDATILSEWDCSSVPYHTGIDISTKSAHSICNGVILYVGNEANNSKIVIVQYDVNNCFTYSNLHEVFVNEGDAINEGRLIGHCKKYAHFEHLVVNSDKKLWPTRVNTVTYYKVNPIIAIQSEWR